MLSFAGELEESASQYKQAIAHNPWLAQYVVDEPDLDLIRSKI